MYNLVAIPVLCFFALMFAVIAIARHVRSRRVPAAPQPYFAQHLFAAVKDQDSRTPRTLPQQDGSSIAKTNLNRAFESTLADTRIQSISPKRF
jgi:hypothetical protein